jgi:hypothetical protein
VYLDTKYWVNLRDADDGTSKEEVYRELLYLLRRLVASEKVLCPIADAGFIELMRQSPAKRNATARLMDELGQGVALQLFSERGIREIYDFVERSQAGDVESSRRTRNLVWTRVGNVIGELVPLVPGLPRETMEAFQKGFDDVLWSQSLEEFVGRLGDEPWDCSGIREDLASAMNKGKVEYADDLRSFQHALQIELQGSLDAYHEEFARVFPTLYERATGVKVEPDLESGMRLFRLAVEAVRRNPGVDILPGFRVKAAIHAAVRWDRQRELSPTDPIDFMHAAAALPYCDIFLTERSLVTRL